MDGCDGCEEDDDEGEHAPARHASHDSRDRGAQVEQSADRARLSARAGRMRPAQSRIATQSIAAHRPRAFALERDPDAKADAVGELRQSEMPEPAVAYRSPRDPRETHLWHH